MVGIVRERRGRFAKRPYDLISQIMADVDIGRTHNPTPKGVGHHNNSQVPQAPDLRL
jgi:hypothetical protein